MRNAEHVGELPLGQPKPGKLIDEFEWRSDLVNGYTVVIRVNHAKLPFNHHGIDWTRVYRVQVMAIEAPHA
jgi:hypothetical protein